MFIIQNNISQHLNVGCTQMIDVREVLVSSCSSYFR